MEIGQRNGFAIEFTQNKKMTVAPYGSLFLWFSGERFGQPDNEVFYLPIVRLLKGLSALSHSLPVGLRKNGLSEVSYTSLWQQLEDEEFTCCGGEFFQDIKARMFNFENKVIVLWKNGYESESWHAENSKLRHASSALAEFQLCANKFELEFDKMLLELKA